MFCHGGVSHLGFNMLFLWIFGNNVEDRMTRGRYLFFYLIAGIVAALAFAAQSPGEDVPLVGASGAVSGVLGAYLFMFPLARIHVWMLFFTLRMRAFLFLPIWFFLQLSGLFGGSDGIAWISHIAGFIAGALLFKLFTVD
jgi:membrane associated rhomboid family serine protease